MMTDTPRADAPDNALGRILWQCRRGMLELDMLLQGFVTEHWERLSGADRHAFERLLEYSDAALLECLLGHLPVRDPEIARVVARIRQYPAR